MKHEKLKKFTGGNEWENSCGSRLIIVSMYPEPIKNNGKGPVVFAWKFTDRDTIFLRKSNEIPEWKWIGKT